MTSTKKFNWIWIFKLIAAVIMLQTLYFKFSGAEESIYIFTQLGIEPYGRIGIGVMELIASALILIPRTALLGAILGVGLMLGAIFSHVTQLGIVVQNDGGKLFALAVIVLLSCLMIVFYYRKQLFKLQVLAPKP